MSNFTERYSRRVSGDYKTPSRSGTSFVVQQSMQPVFFSAPTTDYNYKPQSLLSLFGKMKKQKTA